MDEETAICDFLVSLSADLADGSARPLSHYLSRFPRHEAAVAREFLAQLCVTVGEPVTERGGSAGRYRVQAEVGRGGMGTVLQVHDTELDRVLAMKVLSRPDPRSRRRFMAEARVTSGLDHPGVVPVHEIGVGDDGFPYFTMRMIRGITLREALARYHASDPDWALPRVLDVVAKMCDALAYAHSVGVVHRDLKPSNVMVGAFGQVYVVDWGLAKLVGAQAVPAGSEDPTAALQTMDGDVIGTPSYMAPEQAEGACSDLGPTVDVYSAGAILYHLLTGAPPYSVSGESSESREILRRVRSGAPAPIERSSRRLPAELIAICERAMARDRALRYRDMGAMSADVRAFLDLRVVAAYQGGVATRARKWVMRNRALAATVGLAIFALSIAAATIVRGARAKARALSLLAAATTPESIERAFELLWPIDLGRVPAMQHLVAEARAIVAHREDYDRELIVLKARALPFDPEAPLEVRFRQREQARMRDVAGYVERLEENLGNASAGLGPLPDRATADQLRSRIDEARAELARGPRTDVPHLTYRFADPLDQLLFDALSRLPATLDRLTATDPMGLVPIAERSIELCVAAAAHSPKDIDARWTDATRSIADQVECPMYGGMRLSRQDGLVPVGRDPHSGLWEFVHLLSGTVPSRDAAGELAISADTGVVLVLIPAGPARMGSQREDVSGLNYRIDPYAELDSVVVAGFPLRPFLIGKYEMTEAQWRRLTAEDTGDAGSPGTPHLAARGESHSGRNGPSRPISSLRPRFGEGPQRIPDSPADSRLDLDHDGLVSNRKHFHHGQLGLQYPVCRVSADDAMKTLRRIGLTLPTEMQWEHAYRAGSETVWPTGDDPHSVVRRGEGKHGPFGNVADASAVDVEAIHERVRFAPELDDGIAQLAVVNAFRPNDLGLVGMAGNVGEWCRDLGAVSYDRAVLTVQTGERLGPGDGTRAVRGGSFLRNVLAARSAARLHLGSALRDRDVGVRASREVQP